MKKVIIIAVAAALVLSLGVVAYAANNNRTSQPETTQGEQFPAEAPKMDGEKPSDLPEMNGQPPQMNGEAPSDLPEMNGQPPQMNGEAPSGLPEMNGQPPQMNGQKPSGHPDMIDFDAMVKNGVISQETCDKIKAYMEEHRPSNLPDMNGQSPQMGGQATDMNGQPPQMDGQAPDMNSQSPQMGGQATDMNGQPPQMDGQAPNGEAPSDLPDLSEMDGAAPVMGGLLNELLAEGIITQAEYDALCEATAK